MNIAFMGSDPIALPLLRFLHEEQPAGISIKAVFTQPDRRTGRGMKIRPNAIKVWALAEGIEVLQPVKCSLEDGQTLQAKGVDLVLVMAYGQILPRAFLDLPKLGVLNLHASLLPRLRGASPIHTAVALGADTTGVSLMRIIPKLDAGPVADAEPVPIGERDTLAQVQENMARACVPLLGRTLPKLLSGNLEFTEQEATEVTYCRILKKTDCQLDFHRPARELVDRIRAFQPWPGTSFPYDDLEVRILEADVDSDAGVGHAAGLLQVSPDGTVRIICAEGSIRLLRLQRSGGKPLSTGDFLRGFPMEDGRLLESRKMEPLEGDQPFPYKRK